MLAKISHEVFVAMDAHPAQPLRFWQNDALIDEYKSLLEAIERGERPTDLVSVFANGKIIAGSIERTTGANPRMLNWVLLDAVDFLLQNGESILASLLHEYDGPLLAGNISISWRCTDYVTGILGRRWNNWPGSLSHTRDYTFHLDIADECSVILAYNSFGSIMRIRSCHDTYDADKSSLVFY